MIKDKIKLSKQFKASTRKTILSIVFFVVVYLIMVLWAIGLTALAVYYGIMLIISFPNFFTLVIGFGMSSMGVVVLIFLFKFIFASRKTDVSQLIEVNKNDEPKLFGFIQELVDQVGTRFPKRIYLSPEANAGVFYNSNFWSMFFPCSQKT